MKEAVLIGVDLGTSSCKAVAFDLRGRPLFQACAPLETFSQGPGFAEQSGEAWWEAVCACMREITVQLDARCQSVIAVGLCGQWPGLVLLDASARPRRPAIIWNDRRGALAPELSAGRVSELTGLPPGAAASLPLLKLLWLGRHEPEHFSPGSIWRLLGAKDLLAFRLTGRSTTDPIEARWTGLAGRDGLAWDDGLLELCRLPRESMSEILPLGGLAGRVTAAAAETTGLPAGTPVGVGSGDGVCLALGAGLHLPGQYVVNGGYSVIVAGVAPRAAGLSDSDSLTYLSGPGLPAPLLYASTPSGAAADLVHGLIGQDRLDAVRAAALALPPRHDVPIFVPHWQGMEAPAARPSMRGGWLGLAEHHGWPEHYRAVIEGIAFSARHILNEMVRPGGPALEVRLAGAAARDARLWQIYADALEARVIPLACAEAGCLGAALLARVALRAHGGLRTAMRAMVHGVTAVEPGQDIEPVRRRLAAYEEACDWLGRWRTEL
jgi:xylulokinase